MTSSHLNARNGVEFAIAAKVGSEIRPVIIECGHWAAASRREAMKGRDYSCQHDFEHVAERSGRAIVYPRPGLRKSLPRVALPTLMGELSISLPLVLTMGSFVSAGSSPPGSLSG